MRDDRVACEKCDVQYRLIGLVGRGCIPATSKRGWQCRQYTLYECIGFGRLPLAGQETMDGSVSHDSDLLPRHFSLMLARSVESSY